MTLSIRVHSMLVLLALLLFTTTSFTSASLLDCLLHGSDSKRACEAIVDDDCVWCVVASTNQGFCVSSDASQSLNPYFQCHDDVDTDDAAPPPATDDYWPKNDDGGTFDDDAAVDDDAAPVVNDDAAATDDDANHNDDVDTDDQTPSTDDQTPSTDDDANNDNYEKKLMECLAVGNQTACAKNTPTACIWCTTSFGTGLCVSEQASHDVDGHFYTCQFNSTLFSTVVVVTPSEVYDHYCWNAQQEEACLEQVDGRDVPCVWSDEHDMCLSQAQMDLLELPKVAKEY